MFFVRLTNRHMVLGFATRPARDKQQGGPRSDERGHPCISIQPMREAFTSWR